MKKGTLKSIPLFHNKQYNFVADVLSDATTNVGERTVVVMGERFAEAFYKDNNRFEWGTFMKRVHGGIE